VKHSGIVEYFGIVGNRETLWIWRNAGTLEKRSGTFLFLPKIYSSSEIAKEEYKWFFGGQNSGGKS